MTTLYPVSTVVPRRRVAAYNTEPSLVKQAPAQETDINFIMARYQKTGAIEHFNRYQGQYGIAPAVDFREALELVREAQQMFDALPSNVRDRFRNDPEQFLAFVQDPENTQEAIDLGLATAPAVPPPTAPVAPSSSVPSPSPTGSPGRP